MYSRTEIQSRLQSIDDELLVQLHKLELQHEQKKATLKNNLDVELIKAESKLKQLATLPLNSDSVVFNKQYRNEDGSINLEALIDKEL